MKNNFLIISGISGAGKSKVLNILEDFGFVCVDNLPFNFINDFIDLYKKDKKNYKNVALSIDIRAGENIFKIQTVINKLKKENIESKILFLDANDATILKRYSETRRKHPLSLPAKEGLQKERLMLKQIKQLADIEVDTSGMSIGELKNTLANLIKIPQNQKQLILTVMSFGFKFGIASEADIVFDVRFMPNPNYVAELKNKTGKDKAVVKYIEKQKEYIKFFDRISKLLNYLLPGYLKEGKSQLTIAIGCTGGRHRSVATAEKLAEFFTNKKYKVNLYHRDIMRV